MLKYFQVPQFISSIKDLTNGEKLLIGALITYTKKGTQATYVTNRELADLLGSTPSAISATLRKLEKMGLISRKPSEYHRREITLSESKVKTPLGRMQSKIAKKKGEYND